MADAEKKAFAQESFANESERERIERWLEERVAAGGGKPPSPQAVAFAEKTWLNRRTT